MRRREFIGGAAAMTAPQPASRPNILLIMTDTHRPDAIGAYGNPAIRTPNFDKLAETGTKFANCWSQNPVCMPARATIFTGRYPSAHGVRTNGVRLPEKELTLPEQLRRNGYSTFGAGKFHFTPHHSAKVPTMKTHPAPWYGFEEFHTGEDGRRGEHAEWILEKYPEWAGKPDSQVPLELHNTSFVATHTMDFIRRAASAQRPFFAFASFVDPHQPYDPPGKYARMYREADMPRVRRRDGEHLSRPGHFRDFAQKFEALNRRALFHRTQSYGEVSFIDDALGRIMGVVDETQARRNTLIVFLSDHGDMLGDHDLFYKGPYHFRQCASVPFIVNWPGRVRSGKTVDAFVQQTDIMPTTLALAGIEAPPGVQGRSQEDVLTTDSLDTGYSDILIEYGVSGAVVPGSDSLDVNSPDLWTLRSQEWRLSYYPKLQTGELYDLTADPDEFVNLWDSSKHAARRSQLKERLLDRYIAARDPLPIREMPY
jgi:arylsulfatase A-like enzyme